MPRFASRKDCPDNPRALLVIGLILLTLLAGLFLVIGALSATTLTGLFAETAGSSALLFVVSIVLLCVVIVLLLLLLCCMGCFNKCRNDRASSAELMAFLPLIGQFKTMLTSLAEALQAIETILTQVQATLNSTADAVADADLPSVAVPTFQTESLSTVFDGTPVGPVAQAVEAAYDLNSAAHPKMISGLSIEEREISLTFLSAAFPTVSFAAQLENVSEAHARVQELADSLP